MADDEEAELELDSKAIHAITVASATESPSAREEPGVSSSSSSSSSAKMNVTVPNAKNARMKQYEKKSSPYSEMSQEEFNKKAEAAINPTVFMFAGCEDSQTSADVMDVASFGLPKVSGASKAGGAMTNALISTLAKNDEKMSFADLLLQMRKLLKEKKYTQIPQLSTSREMSLRKESFTFENSEATGSSKKKALLIGINYLDAAKDVQLAGACNDAQTIKRWLGEKHGFKSDDSESCVRVLADDKEVSTSGLPTGANILKQIKWLVKDARPGDTLVFQFAGHGVQLPDHDGDEEDGFDEAIAPMDFNSNGFIRDDAIFAELVAPLPRGVRLICIMDNCHACSCLDLPCVFEVNDKNARDLEEGKDVQLAANSVFSFKHAGELSSAVLKGTWDAMNDLWETTKKLKHSKCCACC